MAQYWLDIPTDPRSDAEIVALFELINTVATAEHSIGIETKNSKRALRIGRASGTSVAVARLIEAGTSSQVDVVAEMIVESVSTTAPGGLVGFATASTGTALWFGGYSRGADSAIMAQTLPTGAPVTLVSGLSGVDQYAYHYRRLTLAANDQKMKVWVGARGDEPGAWFLTATDNRYSSGAVGVGSRGGSSSQGIVFFTQLAIGTDGDPAPIGPVGPPSSRRRSPLLLTPW